LLRRHNYLSAIVTSNLPFDEWTGVFGSERLTGGSAHERRSTAAPKANLQPACRVSGDLRTMRSQPSNSMLRALNLGIPATPVPLLYLAQFFGLLM
jgi:hypothetical protein